MEIKGYRDRVAVVKDGKGGWHKVNVLGRRLILLHLGCRTYGLEPAAESVAMLKANYGREASEREQTGKGGNA